MTDTAEKKKKMRSDSDLIEKKLRKVGDGLQEKRKRKKIANLKEAFFPQKGKNLSLAKSDERKKSHRTKKRKLLVERNGKRNP